MDFDLAVLVIDDYTRDSKQTLLDLKRTYFEGISILNLVFVTE